MTFTSGGILRELDERGAEGVVNRRHERASLQIQDGVARAVLRAADEKPAARRAIGKISGAQQARLVREEVEDFLAVPDVVAAGEDFNAGAEKLLGEARRDAEAGGGIFAVGDAQIDFALGEDVREPVVNDLAAGRADDVADENYSHFGQACRASRKKASGRKNRESAALHLNLRKRSASPCAARP